MDFWEGPGTPAGPPLIMDKPLTCVTATLPCDYTTTTRHGWAQVGCNGKVLSVSCYGPRALPFVTSQTLNLSRFYKTGL